MGRERSEWETKILTELQREAPLLPLLKLSGTTMTQQTIMISGERNYIKTKIIKGEERRKDFSFSCPALALTVLLRSKEMNSRNGETRDVVCGLLSATSNENENEGTGPR